MARRWLPPNVTAFKDRHGKTRYRFRQTGKPSCYLHHAPGTPEFMAEYHAAQNGTMPPPEERWPPFTYDALITSFYQSPRWIDSKPSTQKTYRSIIERFRAKNGGKDVRRITTAAIERKLSLMRDTPAAANNLRKVLARLHRHAIKLGWRQDNPVDATDNFRTGKGFHPWSEAEIDAFDARWPFGVDLR
jgi:hypothetical protein